MGIKYTKKASISGRSKPCTRSRARLLKRFVEQHSIIKTKHLRPVRGFEFLKILGFTVYHLYSGQV